MGSIVTGWKSCADQPWVIVAPGKYFSAYSRSESILDAVPVAVPVRCPLPPTNSTSPPGEGTVRSERTGLSTEPYIPSGRPPGYSNAQR